MHRKPLMIDACEGFWTSVNSGVSKHKICGRDKPSLEDSKESDVRNRKSEISTSKDL